jgi:hypothetical protein
VTTIAESGEEGLVDGDLKLAQFNHPQGYFLTQSNNLCWFVTIEITN